MDIGKSHAAEADDLREAGRHAAGHPGYWQREGYGRRQGMRAPGAKAIDPARQGLAMEMAAYPVGQRLHMHGGFLKEKEIRLFPLDKRDNVVNLGTGTPQQIPTDNFQLDLIRTRVRSQTATRQAVLQTAARSS